MKRILAICLVFFVCLTSACSSGEKKTSKITGTVTEYEYSTGTPQAGGTLRLALAGAATLNPILSENFNNLQVFKLLYDGLFERSPIGIVEPVLCQSYTVSPDGLTYEFLLQEGISFHNGAALTAKDVEATLGLLLSTENLYRTKLSSIAAYENRGTSLVVTLAYPVVNFAALMDFPILSHSDIPENYDFSTYVPNGTGRFKVQSYKKSKELYLSVNENYHKDFKPYLSDIKVYLLKDAQTAVSMLENLQIDALSSDVVNLYEYTPKRNLSSAEFSSSRLTFLGLNNQKASLLSSLTRVALHAALDKEALLGTCKISYAAVTDLPLPSGSFWNHNQESAPYEKRQVESLLIEDGWQDLDGNGILEKSVYGEQTELLLEILVNEENATRVKLAEQIKQAWQSVGISAFVTVLPFSDYHARIQSREYDVFLGGVTLSENYDLNFLLKTDMNPFGISVEGIDQVLNALPLMEIPSRQQALFHELCGILKEEMPIISLYFEQDALLFDSSLHGAINPSDSDVFYGVENWYFQ